MSEIEVIETRGDFRAMIEPAAYAEMPDGDCYPSILRREYDNRRGWYRYDVVHAGELPEALATGPAMVRRGPFAAYLAERLTDAEWHAHNYGGRSESDAADAVLLRLGATDWHTMTAAGDRSAVEYLAVTFYPEESAERAAADWQAWLDGDVWDVAVEARSTGTVHPDAVFYVGSETFDRWDAVGMVSLVYGRDYAEQTAREMFAEHMAEVSS